LICSLSAGSNSHCCSKSLGSATCNSRNALLYVHNNSHLGTVHAASRPPDLTKHCAQIASQSLNDTPFQREVHAVCTHQYHEAKMPLYTAIQELMLWGSVLPFGRDICRYCTRFSKRPLNPVSGFAYELLSSNRILNSF